MYSESGGSQLAFNNFVSVSRDAIFINSSNNSFEYTANYHLLPTCVGVGAGTDGTDIGIFGTASPYKEGAVPMNPHVIRNMINTSSNNNTLHIDIQVEAQDK